MPTHRPRTLDAMYGTGVTPDEAPHVERHVDGEDYSVDVDLTPAAGTLLQVLAATIDSDTAARYAWAVLMQDRDDGVLTESGLGVAARRDRAIRELLTNRAVRQALTIRLTPETANRLAYDLDGAAMEPERCDQYDQGDHCRYYAAEYEPSCPRHLPPDSQP